MKWVALFAAWLVLACSNRQGDPPPPAQSAMVPVAPPNARGALAAGHAPKPSLTAPTDPDEDPPVEDPLAPGPVPTDEPEEEDAGVSL